MATVKNARDILLASAPVRVIPTSTGITALQNLFKQTAAGVTTPAVIVLTSNVQGLPAPTYQWYYNIGGSDITIAGATSATYNLTNTNYVTHVSTGNSVTYKVIATVGGITTTKTYVIVLVKDGTNGTPGTNGSNGTNGTNGTRGTVDIITTEAGFASVWGSTQNTQATNAIIAATGTGPIIGDRVTIRNAVSNPSHIETRAWGGSWLAIGEYIDGNLIVNGTIAGSAIVTNSITLDRIISNTYAGISQSIGFTGGVYRTSGNFQILSPLTATMGSLATPNYISSTIMNGAWSFPNGTLNLGTTDVSFQKTTGNPPFAVSSTTQVNNLKAQYAGTADYATSAGSASYATSAGSASSASSIGGYAINNICVGLGSHSGIAAASGGGVNIYTTISGVTTTGSGNTITLAPVSDRKLKQDIEADTFGLDFIMKLNPVTYRLISNPKLKYHGFIAQEVEPLMQGALDDCLFQKHGNDTLGVDYMGLIGPLVNAVKEQQNLIKTLENKILMLEAIVGESNGS